MSKHVFPILAVLLIGISGLVSAEETPTTISLTESGPTASNDVSNPEEEKDVTENDICKLPPSMFFGYTFETLFSIAYPGDGYTGEESISCTEHEDSNAELLSQLESADTNEDDVLEQQEFDAWRAEHFGIVEP